ncbi:CCAAT-box DNA binding protein subunit B, putative [Plasmodium knowlesi strain H]|uniref:CCAAT-box DNA binding protein subunit B, putative n=3 Tax=Plasmodium knowlesi TaxID=5850 RepID=A0A1A7VCQ1_PLAKH|nr:oocyst rupture protein 1, putative [Plasmodium knowlesi strain H]OTN65169.1 putative CCAAT-box DNA binding protein subunit B [Plasmodium knowlesi]CAA9988487.1 oocyst rupture protein 1, putative [Plasmodium knowlesi strain H]SBO19725.1 CCAAT-box DNA binding protein subunit B, putative [Plasmodium knowlesi strain H]SBO20491.1 CCAAT-box DNA binding protein subunit B, putative [Plasmodium knowlesi strain H]VVS77961.1 oocyst rupture protein 1, putative [Plasmodium knowlesi strain H]
MKNEEIYDSSRNAQNGEPSINTEVKDDKDESKMNGVRYDYIGKTDINLSYDGKSGLNNKITTIMGSENNLKEENKYGYDNEVLASQEIQSISKMMKSKNLTCVENAYAEHNLVDSNLLLIQGDESARINQNGSFESADNLNISDKVKSNDREKVSDYMYEMKSDSDVRWSNKGFHDNDVYRDKIKTGSSHILEDPNMDGEGPHNYLSAEGGYSYDESVPREGYGKMEYKEMERSGKEYVHFDKREKDDERDLSGYREVDADLDAIESDINYYDEQGLRMEMQGESYQNAEGDISGDKGDIASETRNDYHDAASAAAPHAVPQRTLDYEANQNHYQNYEAQKSVEKSEEEISNALPPTKSEQGEKKSLPIFESNMDKTNDSAENITKDNPSDTQVHNDRSNDSGLYRDGSEESVSGASCANDPRGVEKNGNEKETVDDVTWWGYRNDKEGSKAEDQQLKTNIDVISVDKESDPLKGNESNEEAAPNNAENDNMESANRNEGTVESGNDDQKECEDKATNSLIDVDKLNEDGENNHLAYVTVETGREVQSSEEKVVDDKNMNKYANEEWTEDGEKTGVDVLVKKTMLGSIPSEGSNEEEFYKGVNIAALMNVENDLDVTRIKSPSDDAEQKGEYDSNVTTVNSPPKEGNGGESGTGGHGDGEDGTIKQDEKGMKGQSAEFVRSKENPSEFKVTMLSNTNGKDNKDILYAYIKASTTMDDTITSTISDNANEYELVEDGIEEKNEREDHKIGSENGQMECTYHVVANNNKRRRDSFTNDEMNKERKLSTQNASLYGPPSLPHYGPHYASPYASSEQNANKTFIAHAHGQLYGEQKGEKASYESCGKDEQFVNPQEGDQNKPRENFVSYSKENLGDVIFVNRENMISIDPSYDNGNSFAKHRTFNKSNVVENVVQEIVDTKGAYVPSHPQPNGVNLDPNCKENIIHNLNDTQIEDNANGYSEHIHVLANSEKENCDEYIDMDNENNNLSDDCKNSSDDNMEKKESSQFDVNDKKKIKPDSETLLPIANISRIMKRILPASAKVAKESKDIIRECVTEFIQFLTSEASDRCVRERRKTISGEDILFSMEKLGFNDYVEPLYKYLTKWKQLKGMNNSNNFQEKKCEGSKILLEQNATMKKSLRDVNMNNNPIMGKGADNVILTKDTEHLMNNMYRNPNEIFENNINHMY